MASIDRFVTQFQFTYLKFILVYSLNVRGPAGTEKLDSAAIYDCVVLNGYSPYTRCQDLVLNCPKGTLISIADALYGQSYKWTKRCHTQDFYCSSRYNCCTDLQQYHAAQLSQKDNYNLTEACNRQLHCKFKWKFSETVFGQSQYMLVSYFCKPEITTLPSMATTKVATIGSQVSTNKTRVNRETSTVISTLSLSSATQNTSSARTMKYISNLPEPAGVPVVAVVVPSVLIPISIGIGIFIFCRKRLKRYERSMPVDSKPDILQINPTRANDNYISVSCVVENQSDPTEIVRCNGQTFECNDGIKTNDGFSSDIASHTHFILEGQDQYTNIDLKQIPMPGPEGKSEADSLDDDYNRIRFTANGVIHDPNYDPMDELQCISKVDSNGEYSHVNDSQRTRSNDIDYSHINLKVRENPVGELGDNYSHLQVSDDKRSFESAIDNVEYSYPYET